MKITVKDLKQQKFTLDAEPEQTIGQLKENISKEKGWDASLQKLIYSGKVLQDTQTVESYNISEKGFVVCMVSKPKAPPASAKTPATPVSSSSSAATPAVPAAPAPAAAVAPSSATGDAPATPSPAPLAGSTDTPSQSGNFNDPSALALGTQRDAAIENMEAMGFPRADIDRAMRAAFYNPDRAVDYLLQGIPENVQQEQRQATAGAGSGAASRGTAQTTTSPPTADTTGTATGAEDDGDAPINLFEAAAQAGQGGRGAGGAGGAAGGRSRGAGGAAGLGGLGAAAGGAAAGAGAGTGANLEFLRSNPQFQQLRQLVQQQPGMLEPILQQVGAGNPQLAQIIGENPEQFLSMLSEDIDEDAALPPGSQSISVTEAERDAIDRLCRLGFERDLVIQAYFACDKNEELAANFLFDQPPDEDHQ